MKITINTINEEKIFKWKIKNLYGFKFQTFKLKYFKSKAPVYIKFKVSIIDNY